MKSISWASSGISAFLALTSLGWAASPPPQQARKSPLLVVTSPKRNATLDGVTVRVSAQISPRATESTFGATLNGKDITARFVRSCSGNPITCTESAALSKVDGLQEGRNVVRMRVREWGGEYSNVRAAFTWSLLGDPTASPTVSSAQPDFNFTTLTPGGHQGGSQPWFQISSNAFSAGSPRTFPSNPISCTNSVYLLVEVDRRTLKEVKTTCLASPQVSSALAAIPSTSFAVFGSLAYINADWSNLYPQAIGGSDYRKIGDQEAPWTYMMLGMGKSGWGLGVESYNTGYELDPAQQAQVNGVLTMNAHGLYDFHPTNNAITHVDAVNKTIQIDGVTYTPPAAAANLKAGFWVLPISRRTLTPVQEPEWDNSQCPKFCGAVYDADNFEKLTSMTVYVSNISWRDLIYVVAWGKQPGLNSIALVTDQQPYTMLNQMGIPSYSLTSMTDPGSVLAGLVTPDPAVGARLPNRQALVSSTPSTSGQLGQISAVLMRDMYDLYRPVNGVQNNLSADGDQGPAFIDLSFLKTLWQPSTPWPMMDTPGRVNAYQYLSYKIFHNLWAADQQPTSATTDIRGIYGEPSINGVFGGVDPTDLTKYPYPSGGTFTNPDNGAIYSFSQQDMTDVAQQLQAEFAAMDRVVRLYGSERPGLRDALLDTVIPHMTNELSLALESGGNGQTQLSFRMNDVMNWGASMANVTGILASDTNQDSLYGILSGFIHAMSSSGLLDPRNDGIPDYTVFANAAAVPANFATYLQHQDETYDAVFSTLVQDWPKLNTMSLNVAFEDSQVDKVDQVMQLGAKRYFTSALLTGTYQLDSYYGRGETLPSQVGAWGPLDISHPVRKCEALYDDSLNVWGVFPALSSATTGGNDTFFLTGEITNNYDTTMKEKMPPALYGQILFLPDAATGIPGLPKDVWFALGPVGLRNQGDLPRYSSSGNCTR
ncbi:hypothetical protein [Paludibaculum fermentans]|uniref:Uncharacterized protein n=1 Tax=Paludibaculum fermentans TaxID=1473598 RepID=A0A7S7SHF7_PALFE|nr:hypothetical protein [Paludibaculum fermentans]QOY85867.1 hypothetical protein IRI77_24010 [Paludibaculum fermentans]